MEFKVKPRAQTPLEILKKDILGHYTYKQREITKRHREYLRALYTKTQSRKAHLVETGVLNTTKQLMDEKDTLKAKIWVATGEEHTRNARHVLKNVKCHVQCQERLGSEIRFLKTALQNMERDMSSVVKQLYELNHLTVPENQHQEHVAKMRKGLQMLENRLEIGMRRECCFQAENASMREEIIKLLNDRTSFNDTYIKMVQRLNSDKKYLVDLLEYAMVTFESCIDVYEKTETLLKRTRREEEMQKTEMQALIRSIEMERVLESFYHCKIKDRQLEDLQPKEYERRKLFRQQHSRKINLYNDVLDKILHYTKSRNVGTVIARFQEQESAYYSYFNYANEMSYHVTLLNNAVNRLYTDIDALKHNTRNTVQEQQARIEALQQTLQEKKDKNADLKRVCDNNDERVIKLLQGVQLIQDQCGSDVTPLKALLGQHVTIDLNNIRRFLKQIERRVATVTAVTFIKERMDDSKTYADYIVKAIEKFCEWPTSLSEIVLTQQCPECAQADAFTMDDSDSAGITGKDTLLKKLFERVMQPEMQYRLHSISQCRMPRSRAIIAKKHSVY